ncbi:MAG: hypothetical protein ABIJ56_02045 [Pseudomonadota bacterium]
MRQFSSHGKIQAALLACIVMFGFMTTAASAAGDNENKKGKAAPNAAGSQDSPFEPGKNQAQPPAYDEPPAEAQPPAAGNVENGQEGGSQENQPGQGTIVIKTAPGDMDEDDKEDDDDGDDYRGRQDVVLMGQNKTIEEDEVVSGDVVIIGGNLKVMGKVQGDTVCVGGNLTVGPKAVIRGDLVNVGGNADIDPKARVKGDKVSVQGMPLGILKYLKHFEDGKHHEHFKHHEEFGFGHRLAKFISEIVFYLFLLFLALLMTVFIPRQLGRIDDHLTGDFPRSALLGIAVMLLLPLALLILAVMIIGLPVIPLLILVVIVTALMGYIAFGKVLGRKLVGERHVMLQIIAGLGLLQAASILGDLIALPGGSFIIVAGVVKTIGTIIFIGGMFLGLGGVVYSRWGKRTLAQSQAARTPNGNGHPPAASNGPAAAAQ